MKTLFHPQRQEIALSVVLAALSDPLRLEIVRHLARAGETSCGHFGVNIPRSTLSYHLKTLREAGVVRTRIEGTQRHISLRWDDLEARFPGLLDAVLGAVAPL